MPTEQAQGDLLKDSRSSCSSTATWTVTTTWTLTLKHGGYEALKKALMMDRDAIINEVKLKRPARARRRGFPNVHQVERHPEEQRTSRITWSSMPTRASRGRPKTAN